LEQPIFCCTLSTSYQIDLNKLLFWKKMYRPTSDNLILYSLSRLTLNRFAAVASQYGRVDPATCCSCKTSYSQIAGDI